MAVFVLGENIPALLPQTRPIFSMTPPNTTSCSFDKQIMWCMFIYRIYLNGKGFFFNVDRVLFWAGLLKVRLSLSRVSINFDSS